MSTFGAVGAKFELKISMLSLLSALIFSRASFFEVMIGVQATMQRATSRRILFKVTRFVGTRLEEAFDQFYFFSRLLLESL